MKIFISYRRADSQYVADSVYEYMTRHFGKDNVFLDVGSIPFGVDFRQYLYEQVAAHDVVLALIGPDWARIMQERASQANDFVRIEIENALRLEKLVIPVLVMNASMPDFSKLPASIHDLQWRNSANIRRQPDLENDCTRLAEGIHAYFKQRAKQKTPLEEALQRARNFNGTKNNDWTPFIHTFDGVEMCLVPCGKFMLGSYENDDEKPPHEQVFTKPFWIDLYPVTNAEYNQAVVAQVCKLPDNITWYDDLKFANHPVVYVTWHQTMDYVRWRSSISGLHYRLPTEREWEYAARGVGNLIYPWGNEFAADNVVYSENSGGSTNEVTTRPNGKSWAGALHLSGNVWQWCSSAFEPYPYQAEDGREDMKRTDVLRVLRGGSWRADDTDGLRASCRSFFHPGGGNGNGGFRLACSV